MSNFDDDHLVVNEGKQRQEEAAAPDNSVHFPSQKELEKEVGDYLAKKYGGKVRVVSQMVLPRQLNAAGEPKDKKVAEDKPPEFNLKPEDLENWLNRYVVGQARAKSILATKICTHFNKISYLSSRKGRELPVGNIKNNIILAGPTGVGKTYLIKLIASKIGVPFVKGDATKFSETGYVGGDVDDLVRELVRKADGNIKRASCGIIYIDEIDKIASSSGIHGPDISRTGVQRALLKLLEETEVEIKPPNDPISQIEAIERYKRTGKRDAVSVNTRNMLFIVSGAFSGLADIVRKRMSLNGMGFGADITSIEDRNWLLDVKPQDLVEFGFENEFVGRLPVMAVLDPLSEEDLFAILRNPESVVITSKKQDFRAYGIDLRFEDSALKMLAHKAWKEQTGARALVSAVERALMPFEKKLPSLDVEQFILTEEMVRDPEGELERYLITPYNPELMARYDAALKRDRELLAEQIRKEEPVAWRESGIELNKFRISLVASLCIREDIDVDEASSRVIFWIKQIRSYQDTFYRKNGLTIVYDESAVDWLLDACRYDETSLYTRCERLGNIFEYGLSLVRDNTGRDTFFIDAAAVANPEGFVNRLIQESYRGKEGDN